MQRLIQLVDLELDQQDQVRPFQNIPSMSPDSGSTINFHYIQESYDNTKFYGAMQYSGLPWHLLSATTNIGFATASNFYNPYTSPPSGSGVIPIHWNHVPCDQFTSSSNQGVIGAATYEYERHDGARGSCQRTNAEGILRNIPYASTSYSSWAPPTNTWQFDSEVIVLDAVPFPLPQFSCGGTPNMEVESRSSVRNRSGAVWTETLVHNHDHTSQEVYRRQLFEPVGNPWLDQQPRSSNGDEGTSTWTEALVLPHFYESFVNAGSLECGNLGTQGYPDGMSYRNSTSFLQPPPIHHQHRYVHNSVTLPMPGSRRCNIGFHCTHELATNNTPHTHVNPFQNGANAAPRRYSGPIPRSSLRMYWPSPRGVLPEASPRIHDYPNLRYLPADEVAVYEPENAIDQHRDLHLDTLDMLYEELLALGEQIGHVETGLSEEAILSNLKIRIFVSTATSINMNDAACVTRENDFCVICQSDFRNQEEIGSLDCGHEFHADCLKKWLLVKNVCPMCKSSALNTE